MEIETIQITCNDDLTLAEVRTPVAGVTMHAVRYALDHYLTNMTVVPIVGASAAFAAVVTVGIAQSDRDGSAVPGAFILGNIVFIGGICLLTLALFFVAQCLRFRGLKTGEVISQGDERLDDFSDCWVPAHPMWYGVPRPDSPRFRRRR